MTAQTGRTVPSIALVDALKAGACCLIVLHHLAFYGPMSDHADDLFPEVFAWLAQHGRLAVQVFLVLGGYLSARGLLRMGFDASPSRVPMRHSAEVWRWAAWRIVDRFLRLGLPLWVALVLAVLCNLLADHWMDHPSISAPPHLLQAALHLLMLQDITGHEALSAGIWYVAIDFQLFALLMVLSALAMLHDRPRTVLLSMVTGLLVLSTFMVNRQAQWDVFGPYFWVSYGLGVLVGLQARPSLLALASVLVLCSFWVDPRSRLLVALGTFGLLWCWQWSHGRLLPSVAPWCHHLSRISYAVFLVHFPLGLVLNALWITFVPPQPLLQLLGVVTAFKLSLLAGWVFHEHVEQPLVRWAQARLSGRSTAGAA